MNTNDDIAETELTSKYPKLILIMVAVGLILSLIGLCGGVSGIPLQFTPIPELILWAIGLVGVGLV